MPVSPVLPLEGAGHGAAASRADEGPILSWLCVQYPHDRDETQTHRVGGLGSAVLSGAAGAQSPTFPPLLTRKKSVRTLLFVRTCATTASGTLRQRPHEVHSTQSLWRSEPQPSDTASTDGARRSARARPCEPDVEVGGASLGVVVLGRGALDKNENECSPTPGPTCSSHKTRAPLHPVSAVRCCVAARRG